MWGGVGHTSEAGVSRRRGLLRSDHQTVGLLLSLPVPTLEAPNCQQGPPGLPVLSSCHWHFHPCSMTLGRTDHALWTRPKLQPIPLCIATWLSCQVPKSPVVTRQRSPTTEGGELACQIQGATGSKKLGGTHRQLPPRLAETLLTSEWLRCSAGERARLACDPRTNLEQHLSLWRLWSTRLRGGYASSNVPGGLGVQERPSKTPPSPLYRT